MPIPPKYFWLTQEPGPLMLLELLKIYGTTEVPGAGDNKEILSWARELGLSDYTHDAIPWCGLTIAIAARRAGKEIPKNPLWALNWAQWGTKVDTPMLGDVLTFKRDGGGHVGMYVGEDLYAYHVLGGNQGDTVKITRIEKSRLYKAVRPPYNNQPKNVRRIYLDAAGDLSKNEA